MTGKEALETLFASYNYNGNYQEVIEAREKLEQDLERLEILEQENQELKEYFDKIASGNTIIELFRENEELKEKIRLTHTEFGFDNLSDFRKQMRKNYIELVKLKKAIDIIKQCSPNLVEEKSQLKDDLFTRHLFEYKENPASSNYVLAFMYDSFISKEEYELLKEVLCDGKMD